MLFVMRIDSRTWERHESILDWAHAQSDQSDSGANNIVKRGNELRSQVLEVFKDKCRAVSNLRIMIHVPPKHISPGGFSLFSNLADSIDYLGVPVKKLFWSDNFAAVLGDFSPTHLLTSDHRAYLDRIDWGRVAEYSKSHNFSVGLTASIEPQGALTLRDRLSWGESHKIAFYYGFRAQEYYAELEGYRHYSELGYDIFSLEFGANPLLYYPVSVPERDLDYVFLASSNIDKHDQYFEWLPGIVSGNAGFIDGPGWYRIKRYAPREIHRFLYSRGKVGLNLHINDSLKWASELNERTYILAACGIPQLIDNPKLLFKRFSKEAVFSASTPEEYADLYRYILSNPKEAEQKALKSLEEVYSRHTTFHRAESLINRLWSGFR